MSTASNVCVWLPTWELSSVFDFSMFFRYVLFYIKEITKKIIAYYYFVKKNHKRDCTQYADVSETNLIYCLLKSKIHPYEQKNSSSINLYYDHGSP